MYLDKIHAYQPSHHAPFSFVHSIRLSHGRRYRDSTFALSHVVQLESIVHIKLFHISIPSILPDGYMCMGEMHGVYMIVRSQINENKNCSMLVILQITYFSRETAMKKRANTRVQWYRRQGSLYFFFFFFTFILHFFLLAAVMLFLSVFLYVDETIFIFRKIIYNVP